MILDRLREAKNFTNNEKLIAEYILSHLTQIKQMTTLQLAEASYTSKSSVVRLYQKMGAKRYQDFIYEICRESEEQTRLDALLGMEPIHAGSSYDEIVHILPAIYENSLYETKQNLDRNVVRRVVNRIRQAHHVELYGMGITSTIAKAAAFKFMTIGIETAAYDGVNEHNIVSCEDNGKRVALIISFTGCNPGMLHTAKFLKENGVYVVGLCGDNREDMKPYCHEFIHIYTKRQIMSMEVVTSIISTNYIIDILFASLMVDNYEKNVESAVKVWKIRKQGEPDGPFGPK